MMQASMSYQRSLSRGYYGPNASSPRQNPYRSARDCSNARIRHSVTATSLQATKSGAEEAKSDKYSSEMQDKMGGFLTYQHEDGMNFAHVLDDLIVGSCLQTSADLDRLVEEEGVGSIICLQQDSDMQYFNLDISPILERARARGDVHHIRYRINDFDPFDLRLKLPKAAATVDAEMSQGRKAYIHCTAGLGRAPATALAYMYWYRDFTLTEAFEKLRRVRPCNPRLQAIRQATCDVLFDRDKISPTVISAKWKKGAATKIQVAGLDFGWGNPQKMHWDSAKNCHTLQRGLPPGRYPFKFIYNGRWITSSDYPKLKDGDNLNNYVDVFGDTSDPDKNTARQRLLSDKGTLTDEERSLLMQILHTILQE